MPHKRLNDLLVRAHPMDIKDYAKAWRDQLMERVLLESPVAHGFFLWREISGPVFVLGYNKNTINSLAATVRHLCLHDPIDVIGDKLDFLDSDQKNFFKLLNIGFHRSLGSPGNVLDSNNKPQRIIAYDPKMFHLGFFNEGLARNLSEWPLYLGPGGKMVVITDQNSFYVLNKYFIENRLEGLQYNQFSNYYFLSVPPQYPRRGNLF